MNILVLGAGAVGLPVAARLSKVAGVYAVCRASHADAIRNSGFRLSGLWGDHTVRFPCGEEPPDRDWDYIFITAKSIDTREVCRTFADTIEGRDVVSLQNGIGNEEIISAYTDRVIGGMIITGFAWKGPGAVHVTVEGGVMKLGRFPTGPDPAVADLVSLVRDAGIPVEESPDIRSELWAKTLYNSALNPVGALMGVAYGQLTSPHTWNIIRCITHEAFAVATAEGASFPWKTAEEYLSHLHDVQVPATAEHRSSMLQDLERGRSTEIGFLNGAVVERGALHGIPTPCNQCITGLIRFREEQADR
ncbi:MAG: 2-dehydropantoate 2-reductase, partial [Methanoregulaceae archaeon]|nr:2-dehydropantoate 2-reductase [Methanoregulaceae archaeon]